eukprot:7385503-Prymnesium_polylepis.1
MDATFCRGADGMPKHLALGKEPLMKSAASYTPGDAVNDADGLPPKPPKLRKRPVEAQIHWQAVLWRPHR